MEIIVALGMLVYFVIGVGTTKLVAKVKNRDIHLVEILFWPILLVVFAACGDVS